ncbi:Uncharacterized protein PECH_001781 [Penicillium ucsense]|uniref:Uncharacterized protein n=1 Tax=Penicillium ucsense TaxID=2839758 RepID=A0A8J8W925_9EURO|nr:Uncharacterized protein PECM_008079 [Penicillium ucsense]KAF7738133.1 Uncharacterized protein PECH_001781 [Penicillium ucsense]
MPTALQPPDHPIALRRTHLIAPGPDRLTNTPTTLTITRTNALSGRGFIIHHLRMHEPYDSPTRRALLYTVTGKFWSGTQAREIRDAAGRPLLELRRNWWQREWSVKRAGAGAGSLGGGGGGGGGGNHSEELMGAEMRWSTGSKTKMAVRVKNALLTGAGPGRRGGAGAGGGGGGVYGDYPPDEEFLRSEYYPSYNHTRTGGRGGARRSQYHQYRRWASPPPPYTATATSNPTSNPGVSSANHSIRRRHSTDTVSSRSVHLPSYASAHRRSTHSLRELLEAVEPPAEPAPATSFAYSFPPARRYSEAAVGEHVDLRVIQMSTTVAAVMMGEKKIVSIRREKKMDFKLGGLMDRWEVGIAEGVDLLLAVSIVLIMAEFVRHDYRVRIK